MVLVMRKPDLYANNKGTDQSGHRQSDQCLCYMLPGKYDS